MGQHVGNTNLHIDGLKVTVFGVQTFPVQDGTFNYGGKRWQFGWVAGEIWEGEYGEIRWLKIGKGTTVAGDCVGMNEIANLMNKKCFCGSKTHIYPLYFSP